MSNTNSVIVFYGKTITHMYCHIIDVFTYNFTLGILFIFFCILFLFLSNVPSLQWITYNFFA